jgi:hypothetical protein
VFSVWNDPALRVADGADYAAMTADGLQPNQVEPSKDGVAKREGSMQLLNLQVEKSANPPQIGRGHWYRD